MFTGDFTSLLILILIGFVIFSTLSPIFVEKILQRFVKTVAKNKIQYISRRSPFFIVCLYGIFFLINYAITEKFIFSDFVVFVIVILFFALLSYLIGIFGLFMFRSISCK